MNQNDPKSSKDTLKSSTFEVIKRRKRITLFKLGKLWAFKHFFFDDKETFKALLEYNNQDKYRFEFKTLDRNIGLKILERNGFDYDLVEDLSGYVVKLPKNAKYAQILKKLHGHQRDCEREDISDEGLGSN